MNYAPPDYSGELIEARRALAAFETAASLGNWHDAQVQVEAACVHLEYARDSVFELRKRKELREAAGFGAPPETTTPFGDDASDGAWFIAMVCGAGAIYAICMLVYRHFLR
jgi:hypothetical protein